MRTAATIGERAVPTARWAAILGLILVHIAIVCGSLVVVAERFPHFHFGFGADRIWPAISSVLLASLIAPIFAVARFSFGYFAGFFLYTVVVGFTWISHFTQLQYDHAGARVSAMLSVAAFLVPALLVRGPAFAFAILTPKAFDRLLWVLLGVVVLIFLVCTTNGIRFALTLAEMHAGRSQVAYPWPLNYLTGIATGALLPFLAAVFSLRGRWALAATALGLFIALYTVTVTKMTLLASAWLVFLFALTAMLPIKIAIITSVSIPALAGLTIHAVMDEAGVYLFGTINLRLLAVPSSAMDHYNAFFAVHETTAFCQVSILKAIMGCHYPELGVVMQETYGLGNFNASLFATEGIASVGLFWAPLSALACGFVMALANCASQGLPPRFVVISGAMIVLMLMNLPLSTTLLTNGAATLFLLWCLTPRDGLLRPNSCRPERAEPSGPLAMSV